MKEYIEIIEASEHNLKNVSVNIPKNSYTVVTGVSGSGKSSLVFDVLYGEGQRKFSEISDSYGSFHGNKLPKANVGAIKGLTPVIALEQKKALNNPRSTVGTLTGLYSSLRMLYSVAGIGRCPYCDRKLKQMPITKLVSVLMSLPEGYMVELRVPVKRQYKQNYEILLEELKKKFYSKAYIEGEIYSINEAPELNNNIDYKIEVVIERFSIHHDLYRQLIRAIETIKSTIDESPYLYIDITNELGEKIKCDSLFKELGCDEHNMVLMELNPAHFSFNNVKSACNTCFGIGVSYKALPQFMVVAPHKSIYKGALHKGIYNMTPDSLNGVILYSLSLKYEFSLEEPYESLPQKIKDILMYGTNGEKVEMINPPNAKKKSFIVGSTRLFKGFVYELERQHRELVLRRSSGEKITEFTMESCLVESECPDCKGGRLKKSYAEISVFGQTIFELCNMSLVNFKNLYEDRIKYGNLKKDIKPVVEDIYYRLGLLCDIGLYYLNIGRRVDSISGGEAQRIKLASQIGSDLTGLVYILDEPSIGLHPRDVNNLINMLKKLRDMGNTVIVVEHEIDIIKSADNILEIGPGAGVNGGNVVAMGSQQEFIKNSSSLTAKYLRNINKIPLPTKVRKTNDKYLKIVNAYEHNLKNVTVKIPLNQFVCITGVSGSGKSTLINEILVNKLLSEKINKRVVPGAHEALEGIEHINNVISIDQKQIGTSSSSTPATYMGIFDRIRTIYSQISESAEKGYTPLDYSLTHQNGLRCYNCEGKGVVITKLQYMPDIESVCHVCGGDCYSAEAITFKYKEKNISEVLKMSIDEAYEFFKEDKLLSKKLFIMKELGLGYLILGQKSNTISGGEAQRIKLAYELSKNKGQKNNLYVLDEPSTGLHPSDVEKLIYCLNRLVDSNNSVIVIEHNLEIIKSADYIIDIGREGGVNGGEVIAQGTPYEVSKVEESFTGNALRVYF